MAIVGFVFGLIVMCCLTLHLVGVMFLAGMLIGNSRGNTLWFLAMLGIYGAGWYFLLTNAPFTYQPTN